MGKAVQNAFTLVELLVVITILGIIGAYTISNYRSFGEEQKLKSAALDIQSLLRQAQINATTGVKCNNSPAKGWRVYFTSTTALDLQCQYNNGISDVWDPVKSLSYSSGNIVIDGYSTSNPTCTNPQYAQFTLLYGKMLSACTTPTTPITTITLRNSKISSNCNDLTKCKQIKIDPGGRIYEP